MQRFQLFTQSYSRYEPESGVAVRSSNGYPRFVRFRLDHAVPQTYPTWAMVKSGAPQPEFAERYRALLDERGLDVIASRFRAIATAEGDERLVLLCYEDISKQGIWCHRTIFAQWWLDLTGEPVQELGPPPSPYLQDTLEI